MTYDTIDYAALAGVATIRLNRPHVLNSLNAQMHQELRDALDRADQDTAVRCLLLTGTGRGFCAGQDLSDRNVVPGADPPDLGASIERNYNPLIRRIKALEMPVVCAVNGVAAGAGANIALACDIVVAARSASFIQAFCKLGLIPDSGGTWHLPRLVGHARAMALALLGDKITADQAHQMGMIWKVVDDDHLEEQTRAMAGHLASQPTKGLALIKRALHASWEQDLDRQLDLERDLQRIAGRSSDYREGVAAFLEKREPRFQGK